MVSTPGCRPGDRGSIPRGVASDNDHSIIGYRYHFTKDFYVNKEKDT